LVEGDDGRMDARDEPVESVARFEASPALRCDGGFEERCGADDFSNGLDQTSGASSASGAPMTTDNNADESMTKPVIRHPTARR